ncbi:MAG: hypothetical protein HQK77_10395 [Desulfobacterales bacterium]|nr:hypothetical protein [Desulfobacterales bacterium]
MLLKRIRIDLIFYLIYLIVVVTNESFADQEQKILVLNSDTSVEKYAIAQKEFKQSLSYSLVEADFLMQKSEKDIETFLQQQSSELIYVIGTKSFLLVNKYLHNPDTFIVFSSLVNWLRFPIKKNMYGVSGELHSRMQLLIFRYFFPSINRIGVLYTKEYTQEWFNQTIGEAQKVGIELIGHEASTSIESSDIFKKIQAFWIISEPRIMSDKKQIFNVLNICDTYKLPVFAYHEALARFGASLVVAVDDATAGRQAADITTQILRGELPKEKIQFPAGSYVIFNQKKVEENQWPYSKTAIQSADIILK